MSRLFNHNLLEQGDHSLLCFVHDTYSVNMNTCQADSDKILIFYLLLAVHVPPKFKPCDVSASSSRKTVGQ